MNNEGKRESSQGDQAKSGVATAPKRVQEKEVAAAPALLTRAESILKLVAGGAAVTSVIGLPAVYFQYAKFGIPTSFITYDQIFRAGVLPALMLFFVGTYVYLSFDEYKQGASTMGAFMVPGLLFAPIPIVVFAIVFIGLLAAAAWLWWFMLWPIFLVFSKLGVPISDRLHLILATGASALNVLLPFFWPFIAPSVNRLILPWWEKYCARRLGRLTRFFSKRREFRVERALKAKREQPTKVVVSNTENGSSSKSEKPKKKKATSWVLLLLGFSGGTCLYLLFSLYGIRWYVGKLGWNLAFLEKHGDVLIYVLYGTLGTLAFLALARTWRYMRSEKDDTKRLLVTWLNVSIIVALFTVSVWFYSLHLYQKIPAAFGGGKSEPIVLWIAEKSLPKDVSDRLRNADCVATNSVVRCERLFLFYVGTQNVILADRRDNATNAILIPKTKIQAISW